MSTVIALHPRTRREFARTSLRVVPEPRQRDRRHPLRLTRRGRLLVQAGVTVLVLLAVAAAVLLLNKPAGAGAQVQSVPLGYHVVLPGETLWQIAGEVAPGVDRRDTVDDLMELNALSRAGVSVGQRIAYPLTTRP